MPGVQCLVPGQHSCMSVICIAKQTVQGCTYHLLEREGWRLTGKKGEKVHVLLQATDSQLEP